MNEPLHINSLSSVNNSIKHYIVFNRKVYKYSAFNLTTEN